jgi:uncharacterized protein (TIGR02145 family)
MMKKVNWYMLLFNVFFSFLLISCEKDIRGIEKPVELDTLIKISGFDIFHILQTNVRSRVNINPMGDSEVQESGVCWSKLKNPTIYDDTTMYGARAGTLTNMITGLSANTTYYARAYANNKWGTVFGEEKSFTTSIEDFEDYKGIFIDQRDETKYGWIKIGTQVWISENLTYLPSVSPPQSSTDNIPYYYVFDYYGTSVAEAKKTNQYTKYGVYYNWFAAVQGSCPIGWHIPTSDEFLTLKNYLIKDGHNYAQGAALKTTWMYTIIRTDDYGLLPARQWPLGSNGGISACWNKWSLVTSSGQTLWNAYIDITGDMILCRILVVMKPIRNLDFLSGV